MTATQIVGTAPDPATKPDPLKKSKISAFRGGWAVVTGAARLQGLGYAWARQLATEGINVVLVDIDQSGLDERAAELRSTFGIEVRPAAVDLGSHGEYTALEAAVADIEVDVLVCNHMFTPKDTPEILDMSLDLHLTMIDINARAYTRLVHRFATGMRERGRGAVVIVSSGAGITSAPYTAAYSANKAFQIALGEALWYETRGSGMDVIVMAGGLMDTQGDALKAYPQWMIAQPPAVVRQVLEAIGLKHWVVPGRANALTLFMQTKTQSRRRTVLSIGDFMAKGLGKKR